MNFEWDQDQLRLKEGAREFARKQCVDMRESDRSGRFPLEQWRKYAEFGVLKLTAPKTFDGLELDMLSCVAVMEGLGLGGNDNGLLFSLNAQLWGCVEPILAFGSAAQKEKYVPGLGSGALIGALAMSEPESGSDAFSLQTAAAPRDNGYLIKGSKVFSTNGPIADLALVFVKMPHTHKAAKISCLIVEKGTAGFQASGPIEKMGLRTSPFGQLYFDDCWVPRENLLGREGMGDLIFNHIMEGERACLLASQIGVMEKQLETCLNYARTRKQFGKVLFDHQAVAHALADMKVNLETSRLLVYKVAWQKAQQQNPFELSAIAKLHVSQCAVQNSIAAMKIFGGYGYTTEYEVERQVRDSFGHLFALGTAEMMRNMIAELLETN